jgi:hypothetical protein
VVEISHALMVPVVHKAQEKVEESPFFQGEKIPKLLVEGELLVSCFQLNILDYKLHGLALRL